MAGLSAGGYGVGVLEPAGLLERLRLREQIVHSLFRLLVLLLPHGIPNLEDEGMVL